MIIQAKDFKIGTQLAEQDGFLLEITEILKDTPHTLTVRLNSSFTSDRRLWKGNEGIVKTFRKTSRYHGIQPGVAVEPSSFVPAH